jgi:formylglycine-generating enzyme required for sulfatase activity
MSRTRATGPRCIAMLSAMAVVFWSPTTEAQSTKCPPDAVRVGPLCVDRYEASVWLVPASVPRLVDRIRKGKADLGALTIGGAVQRGAIPFDGCTGLEYGPEFPHSGNWTAPLYAASIAGVPPSTCITWFQAEQACRLSGKRLLSNAEWQAAAAGTPDPGAEDDESTTCATDSAFAAAAGARSACVSRWGARDMAGNVWEWVAEWINPAASCTFWNAAYGGDLSCAGIAAAPAPPGVATAQELASFDPSLPGAIIRGGNYATGTRNGIYAFFAGVNPHNVSRSTGFRCAR